MNSFFRDKSSHGEHQTMSSEASVAIEEAKLRLALAEKWNRSAEVQLECASRNVVDVAEIHLSLIVDEF